MYLTKCACGDSEKNFKVEIGPFYVGECCEAKGYDHLGQKPQEPGMSTEETSDLMKELDSQANELIVEAESTSDEESDQEQIEEQVSEALEEFIETIPELKSLAEALEVPVTPTPALLTKKQKKEKNKGK